jgi:hypothetical protein
MTQIKTLIQKHGGQVKLAAKMGKTQSQVARWLKLGAYVDEQTGAVYTQSAQTTLAA